jgi:predicted PurR-regulated permease PerM
MDIAWETDRIRWGWAIVGMFLVLLIAFVLWQFIAALMFAIFIYYPMRRVYRRLDAHLSYPDLTVTLTVGVLVLPVLLLIIYGLYIALRQLSQFVAMHDLRLIRSLLQPYLAFENVSAHVDSPGDFVRVLIQHPQAILEPTSRGTVRKVFGRATTALGMLLSFLGSVFVMFLFLFYLLRDDHKIAQWFRNSVSDDSGVVEYLEAVDADLEALFFGNLLTIVATAGLAILTYYGLSLIAPPSLTYGYSVLLGALTGISMLIPVVGAKLVYFPFSAYLLYVALTNQQAPLWFPIIFFVIALVVVDTIPDFFIRSYLSARMLHLGMVLLAFTLGVLVFGWAGLFLGPIILVLFLNFARDIFPEWAHSR